MRRWWLIGGIAATLLVLGGVAIWYFIFRDTAPPAVNIERASKSVDSGTKTSTTAGGGSSLDGEWTIDKKVGSFSNFTSTFVGYRVNEELAGVGAKTAFGRTPDVTGSLTIAGANVKAASFTADLTTLQSDEPQRDDQIHHQAIETDRFPTAKFVLSTPIDLGTIPSEGTTIHVDATGALTLHGVTRNVTIPLDSKLVGNTIVVTGKITITFADYNIEMPRSFKVLSIEDHGIMELQLFFKHA